MKYLTFLNYSILEATGKNIESMLSEKGTRNTNAKTKRCYEYGCYFQSFYRLSHVVKKIELLKQMST